MNLDMLLFAVFPFVSIAIFIVGLIYRLRYRPFSVSSLSSQLLERKLLYWGSIPFHWGVVIILLLHLIALLFPRTLLLWNSYPLRLYLLELSGLGLGVWALAGLVTLIWRRVSNPRLRAVTTKIDLIVLLLLLISLITGVLTAITYRYGSFWFTGIFAPYLVSLITLTPRLELVSPLPWVIKLHVINFFILLALLPFSRLIHLAVYPFSYIVRPWQIVIWARRKDPFNESIPYDR